MRHRRGVRNLVVRGAVVSLVCLGSVGSLYTPSVAGGRPDCSVSAIGPWNRADGFIVGKGSFSCEGLTQATSLLLRVEVQYRARVHARWRTVASATIEAFAATGAPHLFLKATNPCRSGGWRSSVSTWYRTPLTPEPWSPFVRSFNSLPRRVERCR